MELKPALERLIGTLSPEEQHSETTDRALEALALNRKVILADVFRARMPALQALNAEVRWRSSFEPIAVPDALEPTLHEWIIQSARNAVAHGFAPPIEPLGGHHQVWFEAALGGANRDHLVLTVEDNGHGLDPSIQDPRRVFEKGFTSARTLSLGSGRGQGLSDLAERAAHFEITARKRFERGFAYVLELPLASFALQVTQTPGTLEVASDSLRGRWRDFHPISAHPHATPETRDRKSVV